MREPQRIIVRKSQQQFHAIAADREFIGAGSAKTFEEALALAVIDFRSERPFIKREDLRNARTISFKF